jgi:3-hydroxy acid dehydrogenase / malonic semialdehyde reductase
MNAMTLKNKWVLITGASSGFGAAAARAFAVEGSKLLLGARRVDRLKEVAAEARHAGAPEAHFHALDVSQTSSVDAFVAWAGQTITEHRANHGRATGVRPSSGAATSASSVVSELSSMLGGSEPAAPEDGRTPSQSSNARLDVLINNAGGAQGLDTVAEGKDADWETMLQSNVLGILRVTRAALPLMLKNPGSSLINIGSVAGHVAYEGGAAYCAAKAGELQITRALRLELNGTGIRVTTIDPGMAETEFSVVRFKGDITRARKVYEGTRPLTAEDIADILVWVASRPAHVNIDELLVKPVDQAAVHKVYRRPT